MLADHRLNADEYVYFVAGFGISLVSGVNQWVMYLALEPFVRRRQPELLATFKRLLAGRYQNPVIGRDLLIGVVIGLATRMPSVIIHMCEMGGTMSLEWPNQSFGLREGFASIFVCTFFSIEYSLILFVAAAFGAWIFKHRVAGNLVLCSFFWLALLSSVDPQSQNSVLILALMSLAALAASTACMRFGVLTTAAMIFTHRVIGMSPITANTRAYYFGLGMIGIGAVAALAAYGWIISMKEDST